MVKYTVSLALDCRVDVEVEAESFEQARQKALLAGFEMDDVEIIDRSPVNATDENGKMEDY